MNALPAPGRAPLQPVPAHHDDDELALAPIDRFQILDVYAKGVVPEHDAARVDALATISAGDRAPGEGNRPGTPRVSRDGTIKLHDADHRAPALQAALEATQYKKLSIAVGFDDPDLFLQQRFTAYTATALRVYGDQFNLMEIVTQGDPGRGGRAQHVVHPAGSARYDELVAECKVAASLYFVLAEWDQDNKPRVLMPDGLGFYRLRTTSRHSLRNILGTLRYLSKFTGGRLAGVPLELQLTYREVADPFGLKRNVPTWSLSMKPPHGIVLDTRNFAPLVQQALAEGQALHVPGAAVTNGKALMAPRAETWETAAAEGPEDAEPDDSDIARLMAGDAPADADYWRRTWHVNVRNSHYGTDAGRRDWMLHYTGGQTGSLTTWLRGVTNSDAERMLALVTDELANQPSPATAPPARTNGRRYEEIFTDDSEQVADVQTRQAHATPTPAAPGAEEDDELDPGDMGEGGWAESAADEVVLDPDVGECELCGVTTRLAPSDEDDQQLICADREACAARCEEIQRQEQRDRLLHGWLQDLGRRIETTTRTDMAEYDRRRAVGMLIQRATDNNSVASRELLRCLVGSTSLAKLTTGACDVIEGESLKPEWAEMVRLATARLGAS